MTDKTQILALADKVEKLEGGCRETNFDITAALNPSWEREDRKDGQKFLWEGTEAVHIPDSVEPFTSSIDAAMTLVPEGQVLLSVNYNVISQKYYVDVGSPDTEFTLGRAKHKLIPNAITAAALRAIGDNDES
ncbi:MAG: hypothetical protein COB36_11700 [Alphaproteobacteria bacterium]|nr:MAG: hypothetical protein COB36_11700 [Alphaproteobacteria bacterium]